MIPIVLTRTNSVVSRHRRSGIFGTCPSLKSAPGTKNVQARGRAYAGKAIADRRTPCTLVKGVAKGHYFLQRLCFSGVRGRVPVGNSPWNNSSDESNMNVHRAGAETPMTWCQITAACGSSDMRYCRESVQA